MKYGNDSVITGKSTTEEALPPLTKLRASSVDTRTLWTDRDLSTPQFVATGIRTTWDQISTV